MNSVRRIAFDREISLAKALIANGQLDTGFHHLERAHVLGQVCVVPHFMSHWMMLKVEYRRRRGAAVFGQVVRIVLGALGSAIGVVPSGNTGGTDISMFKRMPIDTELLHIIDGDPPDPPG